MTQNGSDNFQLPVMQRMAEVGNCLELSGNTQHTQRQKNFVSRNAGDQKNYCKNYVLCINLLSSTSFLMYSKNTDKSLDECRRVQTNVDELQTNIDECRRVQTSHQTSADKCRRVQTNQKFLRCFQKKRRMVLGSIFLLLQLCDSKPHW